MTAPSDPTALVAELRADLAKMPAGEREFWTERLAPLLALIAQQAAMIEAVTKERDEWRNAAHLSACEAASGLLDETQAALTAAEAERDRAREALEPLAKAADIHDAEIESEGVRSDCVEDDWPIDPINKLGSTPCLCTVGDLRRARAALSTAKERGE